MCSTIYFTVKETLPRRLWLELQHFVHALIAINVTLPSALINPPNWCWDVLPYLDDKAGHHPLHCYFGDSFLPKEVQVCVLYILYTIFVLYSSKKKYWLQTAAGLSRSPFLCSFWVLGLQLSLTCNSMLWDPYCPCWQLSRPALLKSYPLMPAFALSPQIEISLCRFFVRE